MAIHGHVEPKGLLDRLFEPLLGCARPAEDRLPRASPARESRSQPLATTGAVSGITVAAETPQTDPLYDAKDATTGGGDTGRTGAH